MKIQYSGNQATPLAKQPEPLSDNQKQVLQEILARYKPENFSSQDHVALRQDIKDAQIPRTMETERMIREKGFYTQQPDDQRRIPAYTNQQNDPLITPQIISLFKQRDAGELSDKEFQTQLEQIKLNFPKSSGNLINKPI